MAEYPKDSLQRRIGSRARGIVHYAFSKIGHWEFHEATGNDYGIDCYIELSEDGEFCIKKFEGQIKGTTNPKKAKARKGFFFFYGCQDDNIWIEQPYLLLYYSM